MREILKADLHLHTGEDRAEKIKHSAYDLLGEAYRRGFDVISITNHDAIAHTAELESFAGSLGILLIPGVELTVEAAHVLVLGELSGLEEVQRLDDLYRLKSERTLIIAPHPFFPATAGLGDRLYRYLDLFDALEICQCYTRLVDFNRPAVRLAAKANLPLAAFSDSHQLWQFGRFDAHTFPAHWVIRN